MPVKRTKLLNRPLSFARRTNNNFLGKIVGPRGRED